MVGKLLCSQKCKKVNGVLMQGCTRRLLSEVAEKRDEDDFEERS